MKRVLAKGGNLYFSIPVGKKCICFNAYRIHAPEAILEYFKDFELIEFSGVDDNNNYFENINPSDFANQNYACGLYLLTKS